MSKIMDELWCDRVGSLITVTHALLKERLQTLEAISRNTGIPYSWLSAFAAGQIYKPGVNRIENLYNHLAQLPLRVPQPKDEEFEQSVVASMKLLHAKRMSLLTAKQKTEIKKVLNTKVLTEAEREAKYERALKRKVRA